MKRSSRRQVRTPASLGCFTWNRAGARGAGSSRIWTPGNHLFHVEPRALCDGPAPARPNALNQPIKGSEGHRDAVPTRPASPSGQPVRHLADGERISLGDVTLQIMETPAHSGAHQRPRLRACGRRGALRCARPPQVGTLANHRGVSRGTVEHRTRGLGPAPTSTAGARRSGPLRPSVRRVGARRRRVRLWVSASPRLRAADGRRRADGFAGDRGAQWLNLTDDCCWSSALDPQAYRVARGARSGHLFAWIGWRGHVGCFTSDCRRCVTVGARRSGRLESPRTFHVKPWQCSTVEQFDPPEVVAAVADPGLRTADGNFFAGPASAELYLLSRVLHDWDDWPQVWTRGPAGCARCFTWNRRRCSAAHRRASKPRGSPGWADRGRAPRLTPAESDTQPTGRPWGCGGVPLQRPQTWDAWMFHVEPEAVSRRSSDPDARSVLSDEGRAAVLGDRCSSIRAARFHLEPRRSSVAVAGRSGCPDGPDVSRGT